MTTGRFTINDCRVLSNEQVLKILNQLTDENEQLKQQDKINEDCYKKLLQKYDDLKKENEQLKQYKQSVNDILLSWSQKNLIAKQLQIVIAIMEELNVMGDEND